MKTIECRICLHNHHIMREHCPVCGARRVFLASHSFENAHTEVSYRDVTRMSCELVRAYRSNFAFQIGVTK